ncbi:MAG: transcriptional regulator [Stigonema ocellatum SAG 48.90 = DSM 106950]|nr:transcriptional regulator [Stigonema ocellatum SAG 48.90 = DSM 106950]
MSSDSQFDKRSHLQFHIELLDGKYKHTNESTSAMDMVKRDRFELLSAYLDGEVTAPERRLVEEWLANDPTVQHLYTRLLKLRQGLRSLPVPQPQQPVAETVQQVLARSRRRTRIAWVYGGAAVAACVIGAMSNLLPNGESRVHQVAIRPTQQVQSSPRSVWASPLMVAINNPVVPIPKAAQASPEMLPENTENKVDQVQPIPQKTENEIN